MDWDDEGREESKKLEALQEKEKLLRLSGVIETLTETSDGRYFLRWIMDETNVLNANYCMEQPLASWKEGLRSFGLKVLGLCIKAGRAGELFRMEEDEDARR